MDRDELLRKLKSLAQLDTDAVGTYSEALEHVTDEDLRGNFGQFLDDHMRHADKLSAAIEQMTGSRPELKVDMMGRMADWVTSIRSRRGNEGALHAMHTAENYHVSHYHDVVDWDIEDRDLKMMLHGFYEDEQRHLAYVEDKLKAPVEG